MGHLRMSEEEFWNTTPRAFWNAYEKYYEREKVREQNEWERQRWSVWWLVNIQLSKENKLDLKGIAVFPWEDEHKPVELPTDDDIKRIIERDKNLF